MIADKNVFLHQYDGCNCGAAVVATIMDFYIYQFIRLYNADEAIMIKQEGRHYMKLNQSSFKFGRLWTVNLPTLDERVQSADIEADQQEEHTKEFCNAFLAQVRKDMLYVIDSIAELHDSYEETGRKTPSKTHKERITTLEEEGEKSPYTENARITTFACDTFYKDLKEDKTIIAGNYVSFLDLMNPTIDKISEDSESDSSVPLTSEGVVEMKDPNLTQLEFPRCYFDKEKDWKEDNPDFTDSDDNKSVTEEEKRAKKENKKKRRYEQIEEDEQNAIDAYKKRHPPPKKPKLVQPKGDTKQKEKQNKEFQKKLLTYLNDLEKYKTERVAAIHEIVSRRTKDPYMWKAAPKSNVDFNFDQTNMDPKLMLPQLWAK